MNRALGNEPSFLAGFAAQCATTEEYRRSLCAAKLQDLEPLHSHQETIVDIACKEKNEHFYSGDLQKRQSIEVKLGEFLAYYQAAVTGEHHWLASIEDLEFYLCQCPIAVFQSDTTCSAPVLPRVMELFKIPDLLASLSVSQVNLWMAVGHSRTSVHYDAYANVLAVFHGKKTVTLYPPSQTRNLYARPVYSKSANHSAVNIADPDLRRHPEYAHVKATRFEVKSGDALYIPEGWWHQVDSDPFTIAVNFWFDGLRSALVDDPRMTAYYARVALEELVKQESTRTLLELRSSRSDSTPSVSGANQIVMIDSQALREAALMALPVPVFRAIQDELAIEYPGVWTTLLQQASLEFAALLTTDWDQEDDQTGRLARICLALGDQEEPIKRQLLTQQEAFQKRIFHQVVLATFAGGDVRPSHEAM